MNYSVREEPDPLRDLNVTILLHHRVNSVHLYVMFHLLFMLQTAHDATQLLILVQMKR